MVGIAAGSLHDKVRVQFNLVDVVNGTSDDYETFVDAVWCSDLYKD